MTGFDYQSAGVDLDRYQESMRRISSHVQGTKTARVMPLEGGFAGLFRLMGEGSRKYKDPVLVSGTDGVGTKLMLAQKTNIYDTIGIDLVAMCVNDCLCLGAEPLFFLDYLAMGEDNPVRTEQLVKGIAKGCQDSGMALIGGETAIMPDLYQKDDFDLAGFCVAVVEKEEMITGQAIQAGDVVLGLASSGFHSNGYSLIRKVIFEHAKLNVDDLYPGLQITVGEALLKPTRIYSRVLNSVLEESQTRSGITGIAHITGGGLAENLERILPENIDLNIDQNQWETPPLFTELQRLGNIDSNEMRRVFNMGIGLVIVCKEEAVERIQTQMKAENLPCYRIGKAVAGFRKVNLF